MKILILGGGGAKGWYELGALKHLLIEKKYTYDAIIGNSVGALLGSILCQHASLEEGYERLKELLDSLKQKHIYKNHFPGGAIGRAIGFFFKSSIYNSKPLAKLMDREFDQDAIKNSGMQFRVVAVDLSNGHLRTFDQDHEWLKQAVLASSSYPTFFRPVEIEGRFYTDGGIRDIVPTRAAIELAGSKAATVDILSTEAMDLPRWSLDDKPVIEYFPRVLEIQSNEIHREDIVAGYSRPSLQIRHLIRPRKNLGDGLDFSRQNLDQLELRGYDDAVKTVEIDNA